MQVIDLEMNLNVDKLVKQFEGDIDKAISQALYDVGSEILEAAEKLAPIDRGDLVGSGAIAVSGKVKSMGGKAELQPDITNMQKHELRVSSNMAYSHEIHEHYDEKNVGVKSAQKFGITPGEKQSEYGYKFLAKATMQVEPIKRLGEILNDYLA